MRDMVRGIFVNIPRNFLVALSGMKIADDTMPLVNYYGMAIFSQTLAYPFLTIQRRMECASMSERLILKGTAFKDAPTSFVSCLRQIYTVENGGSAKGTAKTLFRGYNGYLFAIVCWMSLLPLTTEFIVQ